MSTKIYNAYHYTGTLHSLVRFLESYRKAQQDRFFRDVSALWRPEDFNFGAFTDGLRKLLDSNERFVMLDGQVILNPASSVVVYPTRIIRRSALLVQFFGIEDRSLDKLPRRRFRDFHYQNQSDHDESKHEWEKRKRVWSRVLGESGIPAHAGLTLPILDASYAYEISIRVFHKLHGHALMADESKDCKVCVYRRSLPKEV